MRIFSYILFSFSEYRESVRRNGCQQLMPPMSPHAFVHEAALSECFDHVWNEVRENWLIMVLFYRYRTITTQQVTFSMLTPNNL